MLQYYINWKKQINWRKQKLSFSDFGVTWI